MKIEIGKICMYDFELAIEDDWKLRYTCVYYDGFHHVIRIGRFSFYWWGWPDKETDLE